MSNELFPTLAGLTWDTKRRPTFATLIQKSASGREVRAALQTYPLAEWELAFSYLPEATDLATLIGFYMARKGSFDSFLFTAEASDGTAIDSTVSAQALGLGTGSLDDFTLVRTLGGFIELVENGAVSAVYFDGVAQSADNYSVTSTAPGHLNTLHFSAGLPGDGVAVTADFTYSWRVRFKDDQVEFNNLLSAIWEATTITLVQVKA
jgi:uncharacterized protein (TIGR02217 family)